MRKSSPFINIKNISFLLLVICVFFSFYGKEMNAFVLNVKTNSKKNIGISNQHSFEKINRKKNESVVFAENEKVLEILDKNIGEIGNRDNSLTDNSPYNNFFSVNLQKLDYSKKYQLSYEVESYSTTASVTRSINRSYSLGGYVKTNSNKWNRVTELIDPKLLVNGENQILFNSLGYGDFYRIRNLSIREISNTNNQGYEISSELFNEQVLYIRGYLESNSNIQSVEILGKKIELIGNEFEYFEKLSTQDNVELKFIKNDGSELIKNIKKNNIQGQFAIREYSAINKEVLYKNENGRLVGLRVQDLPPIEASITALSAKYAGFRFYPLRENAVVRLKYDATKIPKGYSEKDLESFCFNYKKKQWERVKVDSVNTKKKYVILKASSKETTDYINGVIKQPESTDATTFTPTTVNDIPVANPTAKINLIKPPVANQQGSANLQYPIEIPKGINGLQPNVSINYNSDNKSGWAGLGWDIALETIDIDTRWGVPEFNANNESEVYTYQGEQLVFDDNYLPNKIPFDKVRNQTNERQFYFRNGIKLGLSIIRKGNATNNYTWEITDSNGTKKIFSEFLDANGNRIKWYLKNMTDKYGNAINYSYENENYLSGVCKFLRKIDYNNTSIEFINQSTPKTDINTSLKLGTKLIDFKVLESIIISRSNTKIREYKLEYKTGDFGKTLLSAILQKDKDQKEFYRHSFNYTHTDDLFSSKSKFNIISANDDVKSEVIYNGDVSMINGIKGENNNIIRGALTIGYSKKLSSWFLPLMVEFDKYGTGGINGSYSEDKNEGLITLLDIDGDSMPDKLFYRYNQLWFRKNLGLSFSDALVRIEGLMGVPLSKSSSYIFSLGLEYSFLKWAQGGATFSWTKSNTPIYFSDVNADGLVDLVHYGDVYFNKLVNGTPTFEKSNTLNTPNAIVLGIARQNNIPEVNDNYLANIVKMWEAPYAGNITITDNLELTQNSADGVQLWIEKGSKTRANESDSQASTKISGTIELTTSGEQKNLSATTQVLKGQRIYVIASSKANEQGDKVKSNIQINYTNVPNVNDLNTLDANDNPYFKFNSKKDFVLSSLKPIILGDKGNVKIQWENLADVKFTDAIDFKIYKSRPLQGKKD